jgi:hypothetical protein
MKVLFDSAPFAVLAQHGGPNGREHDDDSGIIDRLKLCALLADGFLILPEIFYELYTFIDAAFNARMPLPGLQDLRKVMASPLFTQLPREASSPEQESEEARIRDWLMMDSRRAARPVGTLVDSKLLATARRLGNPIYTMDRRIATFGGKMPPEWCAPCPFDVEQLRNVSFNEVFDISAPLRAVYRDTYARFQQSRRKLPAPWPV